MGTRFFINGCEQVFRIVMRFKIDTKEKMHVINIQEESLPAILAERLKSVVSAFLQEDVKNVVLDLHAVIRIDPDIAEVILDLQQQFYANQASFVVCGLSPAVLELFKSQDLLDTLNFTPTESEAWDIVQMEIMEREFLEGEN